LIQVPLPVNTGSVYELLIFGHTRRRLHVFVKEAVDWPQIEVEDAFGFGKQPCGLWRSFGAQKDGESQYYEDRGYYKERSACASVHRGPSGIT
jgi:hypothetical protein